MYRGAGEPNDRSLSWKARQSLIGYSDGATYALAIGLSNPRVFSAVVAWAPGFVIVDRSRFALDERKPRVLVEHGTHDQVFPFEEIAVRNRQILTDLGYDVDFRVDENGIHWPRREFQRVSLEAMRRARAEAVPPRPPPNRHSPQTTVECVIRAVADGEADELAALIDFDVAARTEAENFLASLPPDLRTQYRSPEQLVAQIMAAKTGTLASTSGDPPVFRGSDEASMRLNLQYSSGQTRTSTLQFHRDVAGWKLRIPAQVIEGYRARVTGVVFADTASAPVR